MVIQSRNDFCSQIPQSPQSHLFTKYEEKTVLQIMNLAAYANEANECDGISMQQNYGFAALNMGKRENIMCVIILF